MTLQVIVGAVVGHVIPALGVTDTSANPAAAYVSVNVTPVAGDGPLLNTVML